jgi:protein disulfide-isomerase A1
MKLFVIVSYLLFFSCYSYPFQEVTIKNFDYFTKKQTFSVIQFTSDDPQCSHYGAQCKKIHDIHAEAVNKVKTMKISLGTVNCHLQMELCNKNELKNFPILFLFKNGKKISEYARQDSSDLMTRWILENTDGIIEKLTKSDISNFIQQKQSAALIGYFNNENQKIYENFKKLFEENLYFIEILPIGVVFDPEIISHFELHSKVFPKKIKESNFEKLGTTILKYGFPLVTMSNKISEYRFNSLRIPMVTIYLKNEYDVEDFVKLMESVAKKYIGKLIWTYSKLDYDTMSDLDDFGADIEQDQVLIAFMNDGTKVNFKQKLELDAISKWASSLIKDNSKDEL